LARLYSKEAKKSIKNEKRPGAEERKKIIN